MFYPTVMLEKEDAVMNAAVRLAVLSGLCGLATAWDHVLQNSFPST